MVAHLDITLTSLISRELKALSERMKEKYWEEKEQYWNMLEKKEARNEEVEEEKEGEKKQDSESVTTENKDQVKEEKGEEEPSSKEDTAEVTPAEGAGHKEEASSSEINPNASNKTEAKDWQQMLRLVMLLQNEGNFLIKENHFEEASVKFKEATDYVDILQKMVSGSDCLMKLCETKHTDNVLCE